MIVGLGTDLVDHERIRKIYARYDRAFLQKVFAEDEIQYCIRFRDPVPCLAARFAVKEAAIKALSVNRNTPSVRYKDFFLQGRESGKKELILTGNAKKIAQSRGIQKVHVSLSHVKEYSSAVVIYETN